jgi:hypothetical protein
MARCSAAVGVAVMLVACGGGNNKPKPVTPPKEAVKPPPPPPETEADRETKRHLAATAIIPEDSTCLPPVLKEDSAPRLELGAAGEIPVVCAIDIERQRLLGPIGCWKVGNLTSDKGSLSYEVPAPLPASGFDVALADNCARGFCLPKDAKIPPDKIAHMSWSYDGKKVAVLVGEDVHLFDAASKAHESSFSVRGEKGVSADPVAVHYAGDEIFVEAGQAPHISVWVFKADGKALGPIEALGAKDHKTIELHHGSFLMLDKTHVGFAEQGFSTVTTYELGSGKRGKLVRKVPTLKTACKADEIDTFWRDGDKVTDKCRDLMTKVFGALMGANGVQGSKSLILMLQGPRVGEIALLDPKSLVEKRAIKLPWCDAKGGAKAAAKEATDDAPPKDRKTRGFVKKAKPEDPEMGGQ